MLKLIIESELKSATIEDPKFDPDTDLFSYLWEIRSLLIAYGFEQKSIDELLGFSDEAKEGENEVERGTLSDLSEEDLNKLKEAVDIVLKEKEKVKH